jgi:two-component system response regulator NreC
VRQLAAEGLTNAEIGKRLDIGKRTVATHRANLIRKLGLKSHAELVRYAVKRGLLSE